MKRRGWLAPVVVQKRRARMWRHHNLPTARQSVIALVLLAAIGIGVACALRVEEPIAPTGEPS